jgi:hypothetical protein
MSTIHNVVPHKKVSKELFLQKSLQIENVKCEEKGEGTIYFWMDRLSTRGVDITFEQDGIEIRNTILSNKADYSLTNNLADILVSLFDGSLLNEENGKVDTRFPLYSNGKIEELEIHDCNLLKTLSLHSTSQGEHGNIAISGPIRNVHFGKHFFQANSNLNEKRLRDAMLETIVKVNYQIPDYEAGNIMMAKSKNNDEEPKILKCLTNLSDCIIDKYDYIVFNKDDCKDELIMITNDILKKILPAQWELVDEYTIVAPIIPDDDWKLLINRALQYDLFQDFMSDKLD